MSFTSEAFAVLCVSHLKHGLRVALEIESCKVSEKYLGGVLYFTTEDKSGSLRTLSRSVRSEGVVHSEVGTW